MQRYRFILACAGLCASCSGAFAQVGSAGSTAAATAPAGDPAKAGDVEISGEHAAPVTEPGASPIATAPSMTGSSPETPVATPEAVTPPVAATASNKDSSIHLQADPDAYSVISSGKGLSLHKPMFVLPATYSEEYHGKRTEMLIQISLKQRLFGVPLYLGYTQKAFWQAYNEKRSSPFRETDYNPELFYRFIPADRERWFHLGADIGFEHESNGKDLPDSRSWNRVYIAPFQAEGEHAIYWKWWYRLPEDKSKPRTDPDRDDNPDIGSYYGYSELHYSQQLFDKHLASFMFRYNPVTGHGAVNFEYTIPDKASDPSFFWMFYLFQGYGEDLLNYNHSVFRAGFGFALAR